MPCHAAVGINDNFTPSQAAIAHGAANNELTGWVNEIFGVFM